MASPVRLDRGSDVIRASSGESATGFTQLRNPTQDPLPLCEFSRAAWPEQRPLGEISIALARIQKESSSLTVPDAHADNLSHVVDARRARKDPAGPWCETSEIDGGTVSPQHCTRSGEVSDP